MQHRKKHNICPHCGRELASGAIFCVGCRKNLMAPPVIKPDKKYKIVFIVMSMSFCLMLTMIGVLVFKKFSGVSSQAVEVRKNVAAARPEPDPVQVVKPEQTAGGLFGRLKKLVLSSTRPAAGMPPVAVTVKTMAVKPENVRIESYHARLSYTPGRRKNKPLVLLKGTVYFDRQPENDMIARLYSAASRDGKYVICGEDVLKNSDKAAVLKQHIAGMKSRLAKIKDPKSRARMAGTVRRSEDFFKRSSGVFGQKPLAQFQIRDEVPLRYKRNHVWYKLEITSGDRLVKAFAPLEFPLVGLTYDQKTRRHVYRAALADAEPVDLQFLGRTREAPDQYFLYAKMKYELSYAAGDQTENGRLSNIKPLYPNNFPGWRCQLKTIMSFRSFGSAWPVTLKIGLEQGKYVLVTAKKAVELLKIYCRNKRVYPVSKSTYSYLNRVSRKGYGVYKYYLPDLHGADKLKLELRDVTTGRIRMLTVPLLPLPPELTVEASGKAVKISWPDASPRISSERWLVPPELTLLRIVKNRQNKSEQARGVCTVPALQAGSYVDHPEKKAGEEVTYRLAFTEGIRKDFFYTSGFRKKEYYVDQSSIYDGAYACGISKPGSASDQSPGAPDFGRPVRVAVMSPRLYHDNTGPAATRIMTRMIDELNGAGRFILYDRISRDAIEQEMVMTQSLDKVRKLFSESPADVIIQARDRSTINGDYVELWIGNLNRPLHEVYRSGDRVYHDYNNAWRIGRINTADPAWKNKTEAMAAKIVKKIRELRPGAVQVMKRERKPEKFVWGGLQPVNQGRAVCREKIEAISESLMLAASESLEHGDMLSRDDWALVRQERDFSAMGGKSMHADAGGQVLLTGSVINRDGGMEFHFTATEVYSSEVIGSFSCIGSLNEVGKMVGSWCDTLRVPFARKSPYDEKTAELRLRQEKAMKRLIGKCYAALHTMKPGSRISRRRSGKSLGRGNVSPAVYASKQWTRGNRKYAVQLLEKEYASGNRKVMGQLSKYYRAVGLFDKEKQLLEQSSTVWAVARLAQMAEFPREKPEYKYLDAAPDKREKVQDIPQTPVNVTVLRSQFMKQFQQNYARLRPYVAESWNPEDAYTTYYPVFYFHGRELSKFAQSDLVRDNGVLEYIGNVTAMDKNKCIAIVGTWQATDIFRSKLPLDLTRGLLLDYIVNRTHGNSSIYENFFPAVKLQMLYNAEKNLDRKVDFIFPHKTRKHWTETFRNVNISDVDRLLNIFMQEIPLIPQTKYASLPGLPKLVLCDIAAGRGNRRAKEFINWVKEVRIPPVDPNDKYLKAGNDRNGNYRMLRILEKSRINREMIIYRAAGGCPESIRLIKAFPNSFIERGSTSGREITYFMARNFDVELLKYIIGKTDFSNGGEPRLLRYAGRKRLENILLSDDPEVVGALKEGREAYYYLIIGLDSKKVTDKTVEKLRLLALDKNDKTALLHLTGIPPAEFMKSE